MSREPRKQVYLQVEAVNLAAHVFDTQQLSLVRGSSLLLKRAVRDIAAGYRDSLSPLSIGASSGLFLCSGGVGEPLSEARKLCTEIADRLSYSPAEQDEKNGEPPDYSAFTFVVVCCEASSLQDAKERLLAMARFRQLRQPSVAPDRIPSDRRSSLPCAECPTRAAIPGRHENPIGREAGKPATWVSRSFHSRWLYGKNARSSLYFVDACADAGYAAGNAEAGEFFFTKDVHVLAKCERFSNLSDKLAVLYLDGNDFGAMQRGFATDEKNQLVFDETMRAVRQELLKALIAALGDSPDDPLSNDGRYRKGVLRETIIRDDADHTKVLRVETLLWGGDEMTFVVPAWLGFDVLQLVFRLWHEAVATAGGGVPHLASSSHAAGLVFCHVKTPIARVREQARRLAERVKQWRPPKGSKLRPGRKADYFDYLILESIDYPVEPDLDRFFETHPMSGVPGSERSSRPLPSPSAWTLRTNRTAPVSGCTWPTSGITSPRFRRRWRRTKEAPPMIRLDYRLALTFQAPLLSHAAGAVTLGTDAALQRYHGNIVLNGSLIRGNLRHAMEDMADELSGEPERVALEDDIAAWFGLGADPTGGEPRRGRVGFDFFWTLDPGSVGAPSAQDQRFRIEIGDKGTARPGHLLAIEEPFAIGEQPVFTGHLSARFADQVERGRFEHWIGKALASIAAIGAFKGVGFGRLLATEMKSEVPAASSSCSPCARISERSRRAFMAGRGADSRPPRTGTCRARTGAPTPSSLRTALARSAWAGPGYR